MRDIGKGIVDLIEQHAVTKLIMGAAADIHYSEYKLNANLFFIFYFYVLYKSDCFISTGIFRGLTELKSTKATFVNLHAHPSCQIWFTCRGILIYKR